MTMNNPCEVLPNEEFENAMSSIKTGTRHLSNGRQSRSVILESKNNSNIIIAERDNQKESLMKQNDIDDTEALMFMINENLS